jgi:hypothetical protein
MYATTQAETGYEIAHFVTIRGFCAIYPRGSAAEESAPATGSPGSWF